MNSNFLFWLLTTILLTTVSIADAQQPTNIPRIGYLATGSLSSQSPRLKAFHDKLRDLGYVEGQNIAIEYRFAEGNPDRLPELAAQLVRLGVAIIVTGSTAAVLAVKQATSKIPIVVGASGDLVGSGIVTSLSRPCGNITGLTAISPDLSGKRLELLKEVIPKALRIAVLWHPSQWDQEEVKQTEIAAKAIGVKLQSLQIREPADLQTAYAAMAKEGVRALIIIQGPFMGSNRKEIMELTAKHRLASVCDDPVWTEHGCLISYGPNRSDLYRRAAIYVDKILKGAKPADLPVEQPTKFELVINLKTAKQIGLTIPPNVLARADKVIR
jgi:putative ABC transport system substrate-binding protein